MRFGLVFLIAAVSYAQDPQGAGTVTGNVVDSVTHQPVPNAVVSLTVNGTRMFVKEGGSSVSTDAGGAFRMDRLPAGDFQISARHRNYPHTGGVRKTVSVKAGDQTEPITVELIPGSAVSGRVLDEDGDPLNGCVVQAVSARHPNQNQRGAFDWVFTGPQVSSSEGPEGSYRLFGLTAGKYLIKADCYTPVFQPRPLSTGPDPPPASAWPTQFYPSAGDAASAEVIDLAPGVERPGIDFRMKTVGVTHIHVTLGGADWRGRKDLLWQLLPLETGTSAAQSLSRPIDTSTGSFDIPGVFPGSYLLLVRSNSNRGNENLLGGYGRVDVKDRPVEIQVQLRRGVDVSGNIEVEGGNTSAKLDLTHATVTLSADVPYGPGATTQSQVNADGSFTLKSIFPGPLRLHLNLPSAFIRSARLGNTEAAEGMLDFSSSGDGSLRIIVSTKMASIRGIAPAESSVWAIPIEQTRLENARTAHTDGNGQFTLGGLAPGRYRIGVADNPILDDENSKEITVAEGDSLTVDLQ